MADGVEQATRDEQTVRQVLEGTVEALEQDDSVSRDVACEAVEVHADGWSGCRDRLIEDLLQAEDWLDRETALARTPGAPVDQDDDVDFMPSHPTVALVQSAMEERLDLVSADAFDIRDSAGSRRCIHRLRARVRGKAPFPEHTRLEDFRFELADRASVALVSDWGTGGRHAAAVARQIARARSRSRHPSRRRLLLGDAPRGPPALPRHVAGAWAVSRAVLGPQCQSRHVLRRLRILRPPAAGDRRSRQATSASATTRGA